MKAKANSTAPVSQATSQQSELLSAIVAASVNFTNRMGVFFDMAQAEIAKSKSCDVDGLAVLLAGARAEFRTFDSILGRAEDAQADAEANPGLGRIDSPDVFAPPLRLEDRSEEIRTIRSALLIGLSSFGEIERLQSEADTLDRCNAQYPPALKALHPTGRPDTIRDFADALQMVDGLDGSAA